MCGIAGIIGNQPGVSLASTIKSMTDSLVHRGPDASGTWLDESCNVALGHRRLSILDLSESGSQPMVSPTGRYIIVFNGEIYNHVQIKHDLEKDLSVDSGDESVSAYHWKGHSDTEVLLTAFACWGVEATLKRLVGMFAIALWDRKENKLHLMRDRMGEKPLYYGWSNGVFLFASELKAFCKYPGFNNPVDRNVLALYFRYMYVPSPYSIYQDVYKLEAGALLSLDLNAAGSPATSLPRAPVNYPGFSLSKWWALKNVVEKSKKNIISNEGDAIRQLETRLRESIELQSYADVPLGAFLSGGIDSSLVVALMQTQNELPVRTFTIGNLEEGYNEAKFALEVSKHLGTQHTEHYVSGKEAREIIPNLPNLYDEPYADSSQIPTYLVSAMAASQVKVVLSGDGGDELFAGYNRYFWSQRIWSKVSWMPFAIRNLIGNSISGASSQKLNLLYKLISPLLSARNEVSMFEDKLRKLADRLVSVRDLDDLYYSLISEWRDPGSLVIGSTEPENLVTMRSEWPAFRQHEETMMYLDAMTYLQDDILCKLDRAAMGVSLESRVPFLDHRVVDLAWRIPLSMKIKGGQGKWLLRQLLYTMVPQHLIERPKQGFGVPIDSWLRGPLKDWAESLLDPVLMAQEGYLNVDLVTNKWYEHKSGVRNWQYQLWSVLMFNAWLRNRH